MAWMIAAPPRTLGLGAAGFSTALGLAEASAGVSAVIGAGVDGRVRRLADGRVLEQSVRVGLRTLDRAEIADGLAVGDTVLADPLAVAPGARARAARDGETAANRAAPATGTAVVGGR